MKTNKPQLTFHFDNPNPPHLVAQILIQILIEKLLSLHKNHLTAGI